MIAVLVSDILYIVILYMIQERGEVSDRSSS